MLQEMVARGRTHITSELMDKAETANLDWASLCTVLIERHAQGDWGHVNPNQEVVNHVAVEVGKGVIKSVYDVDGLGEIWIMTDLVGKNTFVMLAGQSLNGIQF